jgi:ubiquinone/menaquinone biosynthesis C-methylase UbiE
MFQLFLTELQRINRDDLNVLELGSGPGFLADLLLDAMPDLELTLLDFSPTMHDLARVRLGRRVEKVCFLSLNFRDADWVQGLGLFGAVVTNQAVHELRHKQYAKALHSQVASVLKPRSPYLVCDHYCGDGGMQNEHLYMTIEEQSQALLAAGFRSVEMVGRGGSLVMHRATQVCS